MKEILEFYDIKTSTKFRTSDWRTETKPSRLLGKLRYFAIAQVPSGTHETWRIISEELAQRHRTLKNLKEPGKLSARVREGWGFGGESFLADEIEMLEDVAEAAKRYLVEDKRYERGETNWSEADSLIAYSRLEACLAALGDE